MGCATGELTSLLVEGTGDYHVVEGSMRNIEVARTRAPAAVFHHALFEDFEPPKPFSDILLVCALEHVEDPVDILRRAARWMEPAGRIHIVVPNAESLHRYVGVSMGMLGTIKDLSESDVRIGHRRVYDVGALVADVRDAGLETLHWQGIFLKIVSNRQMLGWDPALITALDDVATRFPANASELYALATSP